MSIMLSTFLSPGNFSRLFNYVSLQTRMQLPLQEPSGQCYLAEVSAIWLAPSTRRLNPMTFSVSSYMYFAMPLFHSLPYPFEASACPCLLGS